MEDARLTEYVGRHRGRRPSDIDWLEFHHGQWRIPRHGLYFRVPPRAARVEDCSD